MPKIMSVIFASVLSGLVGCAGAPPPLPPPPPPPTVVEFTIAVSTNVNPDTRGRASPIALRFYELKSPTVFNNADFFSLYGQDQETLGADLLGQEEIQLMPGDQRKLSRQTQPDTRFIGLIATFRDLGHAQWRTTVEVPSHQTTTIVIKLDGNNIIISPP